MQLFDSHCHLDDRSFEPDRQVVIARAVAAQVMRILVVGTDDSTSRRAVALANAHDGLFASVGVHPHAARSCSEETLSHLKQLACDSKVVAWGETGLDFNRMFSPQKDQERWFIRQLEIADALKLPLIFHERDSRGRLLGILKTVSAHPRAGVIHCFSGTASELAQYLEMGLYIGITGVITLNQRGALLRQMVASIPADRLLIETDAPYLTPTPQRNRLRRNEPAFVREVLHAVAQARKEPLQSLGEQIWNNTCRLFGISPLLESRPDGFRQP